MDHFTGAKDFNVVMPGVLLDSLKDFINRISAAFEALQKKLWIKKENSGEALFFIFSLRHL